jgi:hypothetical protein
MLGFFTEIKVLGIHPARAPERQRRRGRSAPNPTTAPQARAGLHALDAVADIRLQQAGFTPAQRMCFALDYRDRCLTISPRLGITTNDKPGRSRLLVSVLPVLSQETGCKSSTFDAVASHPVPPTSAPPNPATTFAVRLPSSSEPAADPKPFEI